MNEKRKQNWVERWARIGPGLAPYRCRLAGMALGLFIAILFMTLGFWRTILIVFLVGTGYAIGSWFDGGRFIRYLVKRYLNIG